MGVQKCAPFFFSCLLFPSKIPVKDISLIIGSLLFPRQFMPFGVFFSLTLAVLCNLYLTLLILLALTMDRS